MSRGQSESVMQAFGFVEGASVLAEHAVSARKKSAKNRMKGSSLRGAFPPKAHADERQRLQVVV